MLNGIDISSHQGNIELSKLDLDFVIVKATQGTWYVNPYCDKKVQQTLNLNRSMGFYHYLEKGTDEVAQADYFINNCLGYFKKGIPIVDWEGNGNPGSYYGSDGVNAFVRRVYARTGIWCWVYSWPSWFNKGGVEANCGRWVCSYPNVVRPNFSYIGECPDADGLVCCWQYCSDGNLDGYIGNLDLNHFYGDVNAWNAYAGKESNHPLPEKQKIAVNDGKYKVTLEEL